MLLHYVGNKFAELTTAVNKYINKLRILKRGQKSKLRVFASVLQTKLRPKYGSLAGRASNYQSEGSKYDLRLGGYV